MGSGWWGRKRRGLEPRAEFRRENVKPATAISIRIRLLEPENGGTGDRALNRFRASGQDFLRDTGTTEPSTAAARFGVDEAKSVKLSGFADGIQWSSAFATPASSKAAPTTTAMARRLSAARF